MTIGEILEKCNNKDYTVHIISNGILTSLTKEEVLDSNKDYCKIAFKSFKIFMYSKVCFEFTLYSLGDEEK